MLYLIVVNSFPLITLQRMCWGLVIVGRERRVGGGWRRKEGREKKEGMLGLVWFDLLLLLVACQFEYKVCC